MTLTLTKAVGLWVSTLLLPGVSELAWPDQTPRVTLSDLWEDTPVTKDPSKAVS
jgi:hypothetical protein